MIDLSKVRNYYIACGYTDLCLGIDGLVAVVTQQYGGRLDEERLFLFCGRLHYKVAVQRLLTRVSQIARDTAEEITDLKKENNDLDSGYILNSAKNYPIHSKHQHFYNIKYGDSQRNMAITEQLAIESR